MFFVPVRTCQATRLFWLSLLLDSLFCKETEESISSNGERRFNSLKWTWMIDSSYVRLQSLAPSAILSYHPNTLTSIKHLYTAHTHTA